MDHLTLKAQTTVDTELGTFQAVISSWSADREGDTIARSAFDQSLEDWRRSGKSLPLLFEHSVIAVGSLDPASMYTDERGLIAAGEIDRDTREGKQAWAQVKRGSAGFSIGFLTVKSQETKGGQELQVIDLLEVSITSTPAHPAARVVSWKSAAATTEDPLDSLPEEEAEILADLRAEWEAKRSSAVDAADAAKRREMLRDATYHMPGLNDEGPDDAPIPICGVWARPSAIRFHADD